MMSYMLRSFSLFSGCVLILIGYIIQMPQIGSVGLWLLIFGIIVSIIIKIVERRNSEGSR